jgi:hypothetical protein
VILKLLYAAYWSIFPAPLFPLIQPAAAQPAQAVSDPAEYNLTLNSLGGLQSEASDPQGGTAPAGTRASDLFTVGDFEGLGFADLTFQDIQTFTGEDLASTPIVDVPVLANSTPEELARSVDGLEQQKLEDAPTYEKLAQSQGVRDSDDQTVGDVAPKIQGTFGDNAASIAGDIISDVPGLFETTKTGELPNGLDSKISDINGLGDVGIYDITSIKDLLAPFDIGFAGGKNFNSPCKVGPDCEEKPTLDNSASGNWDNFHIPCSGPDCSHIEVRRQGGISAQNNIRWFTNKQKWVPGGTGWLCLKEPVGRYPFGDRRIKVVVTDIDEKKGTVEFGAYVYVDGPFGSYSANCFGPFPIPVFGKRKEGELTLFGIDKKYAREELQRLAERIRSSSSGAGSGGRRTFNGKLPDPVDCEGTESQFINPAPNSILTSRFGPRKGRMHNGLDLARHIGAPVVASNCGVVTYSDWNAGGYGRLLIIRHPGGTTTRYAHNNLLIAKVGQEVRRGQLIAEEGTTGRSTGPHVHFEVRTPGPIDPCNVLDIC